MGRVRRTTALPFFVAVDSMVDSGIQTGIQSGSRSRVYVGRRRGFVGISARRLTRQNVLRTSVRDSFFGSSGNRTGLSRNPNPLFSGSFPAENVCWGAQRGISLAAERFFWESTPRGIHPETLK
jgi:hypothetical protein